MNDKLYIHEYVDIIAQNRANYLYHMTANYSPIAQEERGQQCFGVWGVVGTTARWPQVINIWEENGFDGMAASFAQEYGHETLQDPKLARWWAQAAGYRSGGYDRLLVPAPWMPTTAELTAKGVTGEVHAHVQVALPPGTAPAYLDAVGAGAEAVTDRFGWQLSGAWSTAMVDESECILLWTIPTWAAWSEFEQAVVRERAVGRFGGAVETISTQRFLMVDAPLSPFRTGRQPSRDDRTADYVEA